MEIQRGHQGFWRDTEGTSRILERYRGDIKDFGEIQRGHQGLKGDTEGTSWIEGRYRGDIMD